MGDLTESNCNDETPVLAYPCTHNSNQKWTMWTDKRMTNQACSSSKCLDVKETGSPGYPVNYAPVQIYSCHTMDSGPIEAKIPMVLNTSSPVLFTNGTANLPKELQTT